MKNKKHMMDPRGMDSSKKGNSRKGKKQSKKRK